MVVVDCFGLVECSRYCAGMGALPAVQGSGPYSLSAKMAPQEMGLTCVSPEPGAQRENKHPLLTASARPC